MAKQFVTNNRTFILVRGEESTSMLQQMVIKSIKIKKESIASRNITSVPESKYPTKLASKQ